MKAFTADETDRTNTNRMREDARSTFVVLRLCNNACIIYAGTIPGQTRNNARTPHKFPRELFMILIANKVKPQR